VEAVLKETQDNMKLFKYQEVLYDEEGTEYSGRIRNDYTLMHNSDTNETKHLQKRNRQSREDSDEEEREKTYTPNMDQESKEEEEGGGGGGGGR
jgi:hypothetical protein